MTEQAIAVPAFEQAEVQERMRTARKRRTISHQPVSEFVEELKKAQAKAKDFLVPYGNLRVAVQSEETIDGEGVSDSYKLVLCLNDITIDGKKHDRIDVPFYEHVLGHISTHTGVDTAGVPIAYLRRLLANSKDSAFVHLAAANVNEWLSRRSGEMHTKGAKGVKCVLVRTFLEDDGRYYCRAIVSDRYFPLRTLDMVTIALGVVLGKTGDAEIDRTAAKNAWMFDQRISVEEVNVGFVNPLYAFDLRHPSEGIIQAERVTMSDEGIPTFHYRGGSAYTLGGKWTGSSSQQHLVLPACRISNSETGGGSAVIEPMMIEVACINGMTLMKAMKRNHLGGLMESADIYESDATRKKKLEVVLSQMSDAMKQVFDLKQFEENCKKFLGLTEVMVKDVKETAAHLLSAIPGGDGLLEDFLKAYEQFTDGKDTLFDVQRGLTNVAQDQEFAKQAAIEALAGSLVNGETKVPERLLA